jgi:hypothetical protein
MVLTGRLGYKNTFESLNGLSNSTIRMLEIKLPRELRTRISNE